MDCGDITYIHVAASGLKYLECVYHYDAHHCVLYERVGWPSLEERHKTHWFLCIFKVLLRRLQPYIVNLVEWSLATDMAHSSEELLLKVPC